MVPGDAKKSGVSAEVRKTGNLPRAMQITPFTVRDLVLFLAFLFT